MTFHFQAKYGMLTYSQANDLDPWSIVDLLSELGCECIVGRENHQDGGTHYHAFFEHSSKLRSKDPRVFDIGPYHPNILTGRKTPGFMFDYATKDGDICAGGLARPSDVRASVTGDTFWEAVFSAETRDATLDIARRTSPALFGRYYFQVRAIAESKAADDPTDYEPDASHAFSTAGYPELNDWLETHLGRRGGRYVYSYSLQYSLARPSGDRRSSCLGLAEARCSSHLQSRALG